MKNGLNLILSVVAGAVLLQAPARAADEKADFKDDREKASYAIGMFFGNQIKRSNMDVDVDLAISTMKDVLAGRTLKFTEEQARQAIMEYQKQAQQKLAEKNKKEGEAFLAENRKKEGVKVQKVALPDGTPAEFQYKVIAEGSGPSPKSNDVVTVNYTGKLINGTEFDSSAKHGQPLKRPANTLVRGWTEALQMMKAGAKWEIYLPSSLAYGDRGSGPLIEPGSTLVFEMELVSFEAPPQAAVAQPGQPLTSDIIKVPSADELKKGAKIEVIKAEDAAKAAKEAAEKNKEKQ